MGPLETFRWCRQVYLNFEDRCLHLGSIGGLCQRVPSPVSLSAPLSPSLPLSTCQDDEALARSCSPLFEQHACSEESSVTQGPEPPRDLSSDLVSVSISGAYSSPSVLLASDGLLSASEQDQCNKTEGALPEREGESQGEEGLGGGRSQEVSAELRGGACRTEEPGGLCFYVGISSPSFSPPALSSLGSRVSPPSEQSLDEEPAKLQGAEQNQENQKKIDALPAFVSDYLDSSEQLPLEEQSDPLRCEEAISGDRKEALLSLGNNEKEVAGLENGADGEGSQGTISSERRGCSIQDFDGVCLNVPGGASLLLANAVPVFGCGEGREGALPEEREKSQDGKGGLGGGRSEEIVLTEPSGAACLSVENEGACLFEKLDGGCLFQILSHLDSSSLNNSSLVCCEWLRMARDVRETMDVRTLVQCSALPFSLPKFPRLQTLTVTKVAAKHCFGDRDMRDIALKAPQLRRLEVVDCRENLTDAGLAAVLRGCSGLQVLNLTRCNGFSGVAFGGVRWKLSEIKLEECKGLTNEGLGMLAAACPKLENFTLRRLKGDASLGGGLEALAQRCGSLGRLTLRGAGITDACLGAFARNCCKLDMVSLSREPAITDGGVATLIERSPVLQRLALTDNQGLTRVPRSRTGAPLKLLGLSGWLTISDEGLRQVSLETSLEELHLYACPNLTDATVAKVLVGCRNLKRLVVSQCALLTPNILTSYVESGSKAHVLVVGCEKVPKSALSEDNRHLGKVVIKEGNSVSA